MRGLSKCGVFFVFTGDVKPNCGAARTNVLNTTPSGRSMGTPQDVLNYTNVMWMVCGHAVASCERAVNSDGVIHEPCTSQARSTVDGVVDNLCSLVNFRGFPRRIGDADPHRRPQKILV